MSLPVLPLSDSFPLAWEYDPAFDRKVVDDKIDPDFVHAYQVAMETYDWSKLSIPGKAPTLFHFRLLTGMPLRHLVDMEIGFMAKMALAFRMALVKVENGDGVPALKREIDPNYPSLGQMANADLTDVLDGIPGRIGAPFGHIVSSLGNLVYGRSLNLSPRS